MKDFSKKITAYALKNSIEFGKADAGKILPKLFQHGLEKKDIRKIMPEIAKIVNEINKLGKEEKEKKFKLFSTLVREREEKEKTLPELPNAKGKVITRLPPEPSKYLHLGHALSFLINYLYAKKYKGKCIIRFEDANPEKVSKEYADGIIDDVKNYLGIKVGGIKYVSDDMLKMYKYAVELIAKNKAFMCFCDREKMQSFRHEGKECDCRNKSVKENKNEWAEFLAGKYNKGEAVLRFKGDMKNLNHVLRDPVLFRLINAKHFRQGEKYKVWPMYDFYNPVEDSLMKITHILRTNEFDARIELHEEIKKILGLKTQTVVQYGRFNVIGAETKGREIRQKIESGEYSGWDDPRLVTLKTLKRRGIIKEVLHELVNYIGLSKKQVNIDFAMIASISRKILDKKTNRYFFVHNPVSLKILKMPGIKKIKAKIHPEKKEERTIPVGENILISKDDYDSFVNKEVRLMNLFNIKLGEKPSFTGMENKNVQKIQWVSKDAVKVKVMMDDGKFISGIAEPSISSLSIGDIVQFERFGFARLDKKNKEYEFWFTHK